ncbi:hypothetical protein XA68_17946 [Ophiocordyceps unilateralis]|uniref:RNA-binding S4 domain-containing protein n=1 Tax=Ophiocordyceps unilateralis TaxID=268505 RepID=A0A2A9P362_OPHUN|nr:hypothetical protein XA68_17946 [Ophiocordyceps unilateralis]
MRRPSRYYNLTRPKLRQSWNKHVLFNLYRGVGREPLINRTATFFQQKWAAKSKTRGYHGDHIPEKKWVRLFSRRLLSVVDMPPQYLAAHDGSEQAAGRGSGMTTLSVTAETYSTAPQYANEDSPTTGRKGDVNKLLGMQYSKMTPYMQMTYAPLERRLETAIFRSLFASSIREARQFCVHGAVKVNGIKMVYPAYELNPGDMFQVDIEKVLYATGEQRHPGFPSSRRQSKSDQRFMRKQWSFTKRATTLEKGELLLGEDVWARYKARMGNKPATACYLNQMMVEAALRRSLACFDKEELIQVRAARLLRYNARRWLSLPEDLEMEPRKMMYALRQLFTYPDMAPRLRELWLRKSSTNDEQKPVDEKLRFIDHALRGDMLEWLNKEPGRFQMGPFDFTPGQMRWLIKLLGEVSENLVDDKKPYATPWRPRPYMSAFAFIPRYLEVNPYVCAAVYLRHPVARKGLAEVPTPFSYLTSQLAHNWYLGRG